MTGLNYIILTGLLLLWIRSVRDRMLPSVSGNCILSASFLMLLYMLLRIFKYRFAVEPVVMRYVGYAYWIPQMLIPALFLMACICIRRRKQEDGIRWEGLLLIPAVMLAMTVMTNDLHFLIYNPKIDLSGFSVDSGTYVLGPVFYLMYVWMVLTAVTGLVLLSRETGRLNRKAVRDLLLVIALWFGIIG